MGIVDIVGHSGKEQVMRLIDSMTQSLGDSPAAFLPGAAFWLLRHLEPAEASEETHGKRRGGVSNRRLPLSRL